MSDGGSDHGGGRAVFSFPERRRRNGTGRVRRTTNGVCVETARPGGRARSATGGRRPQKFTSVANETTATALTTARGERQMERTAAMSTG